MRPFTNTPTLNHARHSLTHTHTHTHAHTYTHIHTQTHTHMHTHTSCAVCDYFWKVHVSFDPRLLFPFLILWVPISIHKHIFMSLFCCPLNIITRNSNSWTDSHISLEPERKRLQTTSNVCEHCDRPVTTPTRHVLLDGQVFCKFSGRYQCRCGRWWNGMALKLQELNPSHADAFPEQHFPDCLTCGENYFVELTGHQSPQAHQGETRRTDRGHQRQACTLCKAGAFCPRA